MSNSDGFRVRRLRPDEMTLLTDWMEREGWNPGLQDAAAFAAADPEGFFVGELDGRPVACGSAVRYGDDFAFCGCFIVDPAYRGRGYGWALTQARLQHVGSRITGIDGVVAMQQQYRRIGYEIAYRNVRYGGLAPDAATRPAEAPIGLVALGDLPLAALADFDAEIFPARRETFLQAWRSTAGHVGLAALAAGGRIRGYGLRRPCRSGWKIGPLFADDAATAAGLLDGLLGGIAGERYFLDVPEPNAASLALARERGLAPVFETARMYRNGRPRERVDRVYGVTTFELG